MKTATFKAIAKYFDRPILLATVSELTTTGVVGADFSDIIVTAIKNCNGDIQKAEKSIIFLDEFDKLARRNHGMTSGKDVGGESVQQIMLKYLEGDKVMVQMGSKRNPFADNTVEFDTSDVLFVLAGAFEGLTSIIKSRINKKAIGFNSKEKQYTDDDYLEHVTTDDLVQFGIIPELIGRCPKIITYKQLTEDNLVDILTKPKNALVNQYKELFKMDNVNLHFTDDALRTIAQIAIKNKTNARGLRSILSQILDNIEYIIPERDNISDIIITDNIFEKFKNNETDEIVLLS